MTTLDQAVVAPVSVPRPLRRPTSTTGFWSWFTTVDHKKIGILYGVTALAFLIVGGIEALLIRLQLAGPNGTVLTAAQYNTMFTMHGTTMIFLMGMPLSIALANYFVPLQIGARDVAFPRLNMFGYWVVLFGGLFMYSSFILGRAERWVVRLHAPHQHPDIGRRAAGQRSQLLGRRYRDARHRLHHLSHQLDRDGHQHAGAGHDPHAHAAVHVVDARDRIFDPLRDADRHRGDDHGVLRPQLRHLVLRGVEGRRSAPLSEPLLVIRPSRRCTSSSSRGWASSPKSSRCSPASRCSATRS